MGEQVDFTGVFPYLVLPVNSDGSVKEEVLTNLVKHLLRSGVHGLVPLGSTGEFAYLTAAQRKEIVRVVIQAADHEVPVIAGVCHTSIAEASRQAREYRQMGVDGILAIMDTYFPVTPTQVLSYFQGIAESVNCPIVIYNNPRYSRVDFSIELVEQLAEIPNVDYLKYATGQINTLLTMMNRLEGKIRVFSASANVPLFVMMHGGVGWMAGPACIIPRQSVKLYELAREKRWDEAIELHKRLWEVHRLFQEHNLSACIKAGLIIQGFPVGDPVPPLTPLDPENMQEVERILSSLE